MSKFNFSGQTLVVTGAGSGVGREYATFFASRGANVVVNDDGYSLTSRGGSPKPADAVVKEIKARGGKAVANYDSVENGDKVIQTAIDEFGRIDILINNATILRDNSFEEMVDEDWDHVNAVNVKGAFKCSRAAWIHFKRQKYGRIINTTSEAGLFGNIGQANFSATKLAQIGFTKTLAKEGIKYNILCNVIAPIYFSAATLDSILVDSSGWTVPLIAVLAHSSNTTETGSIFEIGGGYISKIRWQRAEGSLLKTDSTYTPGAVLATWDEVKNYSKSGLETGPVNFLEKLKISMKSPPNPVPMLVKGIDGRVAVITGAGAGLGRAYALLLGKMGAKIVVNDLVDPYTVVDEIKKAGGEAVGSKANVCNGARIIKTAIDNYGRVDILINNAGIIKDKAFSNMDDKSWDDVFDVHAKGTYSVTKAAWPHMKNQKYGRIVNTTSSSAIFGNFGQSNYSTAKCAIIGFSRSLGWEGVGDNIFVNTIAPSAGTQLTATVMPEETVRAFKPDFVAPIVALLCSDSCPDPTLGLYEVGGGWQAQIRWQRSGGHRFPVDVSLTPESVVKQWDRIINFNDGRADNPRSMAENARSIVIRGQNSGDGDKDKSSSNNEEVLSAIDKAKQMKFQGSEMSYTEKDVILYNLGIGAKREELSFIYENSDNFQAIPSFGVIPPSCATPQLDFSKILPKFSSKMLLHGEQYLEIRQFPIPTKARLITYQGLIDVVDKGNAGIIIQKSTTVDKNTQSEVFYNETTIFVKGSGGFGGPRSTKDRGAATAPNTPPQRPADKTVYEKTNNEQAALYRLSGDRNPIHIDPTSSNISGFQVPILHGLCFFGIATKHILNEYGPIKNIKVRFASSVQPGQTLRTEMWREGTKVIFQVMVVETGKLAITGGGAELRIDTALKL